MIKVTQRRLSEKLPKMFRRKITQDVDENHLQKEKMIFIQEGYCWRPADGPQWSAGTTGDAALRLIGKKKKSRITASIGKFGEWRTRKRGDEGQKREAGKK